MDRYVLHLYVAGTTPRSIQAVAALRAICDRNLAGRFELAVFDVYQQPELARTAQIVAVPTLVRLSPEPVRRILGDLSNTAHVLAALDLPPEPHEKARRKTPKR
ncbi:MAG: KaiB [Labilithrix sp.]|nr:KaiB [Labilithrix sp.]